MDKNSVCSCVLVLILLFECSLANSPCPNIFGFFTDGKSVFGQITLQPVETVPSLQIRISFTVQADLGDYLGRIDSPDDVLDKYNRGETITYRVNFPVISPRPKVTEIALNGQIICTGPGDKPTTRVISHPTLQVTNSYGVGGGPPPYKKFQHKPQMTAAPQIIKQTTAAPQIIKKTTAAPQIKQQTTKDYIAAFVQNINNRFGGIGDNDLTTVAPQPTRRPTTPQKIQQTDKDYAMAFVQNINNAHGSGSASSPFHPFFFTTQSQSNPGIEPSEKPSPPPKLEYVTMKPSPPPKLEYVTMKPSPPPKLEYVTMKPYTPPKLEQVTMKPSSLEYSRPVMKVPRPHDIYTPSTTTDECGLIDGGNQIQELVYNGHFYERGIVPWLVAIFSSKGRTLEFICGGTLVSNRHVVTAAHCKQGRSSNLNNRDIVVKVGIHALDDWSDDISVTRRIMNATMHESYFSFQSLRNDIMVLTLDKRVKFNRYIRPACLWSGDTELSRVVGDTGVVAGWGDRGDNNKNQQEVPQLVRIPIVSTKDCRASNSFFHQVTYNATFCAGDRDGTGPCSGDSGGGLYLKEDGKWRLRGVVSMSLQSENGARSCNLNEYVVFTDTAQYLPWIRSILSYNYFD